MRTQTAAKPLPPVLAEHVGLDEEGMLGFTDEASQKVWHSLK
jgi:hypothetical protein